MSGLAASIRMMHEVLLEFAESSGEPAFLRAANALYQQAPGRPAYKDAKLIEEAQWMLEQGKAKSVNQALENVARTVADEHQVKSVVERLRRKMRSKAKIHPRNG